MIRAPVNLWTVLCGKHGYAINHIVAVARSTPPLAVVLVEDFFFWLPLGVWNGTGGLDNIDVGCSRRGSSACSGNTAGKGCRH